MSLLLFELVGRVVKDIVETKDDTIYVYINSQGGDDDCDYAIYEALRLSGKEIITHNVQYCNSAAFTIYLAGTERYCTNHSTFLIHEAYQEELKGSVTRVEDYQKMRDDLLLTSEKYFKFISDRTKLTTKRINSYISKSKDKDWLIDAKLAKKLGIVTKVGFPLNNV